MHEFVGNTGARSVPNIVIAGKSRLAVDCLKFLLDGLNIEKSKISVVPTMADTGEDGWQPSLLRVAKERRLGIAQYPILSDENALFFSLEFDRIIKTSRYHFLDMFNIHFSRLPAYKGCWNSIMPILNGEAEAGVTLHQIDDGIDTGDIVDQRAFEIGSGWRACDLYETYIENGIDIFKKNIECLTEGKISLRPQELEGSTYVARNTFDPKCTEVCCRKTWVEIDRFVRALYFPAYQTATFEGNPVLSANLIQKRSAGRFGAIAKNGNIATDVQCIDAVVRLWHSVESVSRYSDLKQAGLDR